MASIAQLCGREASGGRLAVGFCGRVSPNPLSEVPDHDITRLLRESARGDEQAVSRLMDLVYPELHRIAARHLRGERRRHTLQPTALVNEATLRLAGSPDQDWQDRTHFFAVAARVVRRILVDHARARRTIKRDAGITIALSDASVPVRPVSIDVLDLDRALSELEGLDSRQCRVVELRYFGGLSIDESAEVLRTSPSSVKRDWLVAKTWLRRRMIGEDVRR